MEIQILSKDTIEQIKKKELIQDPFGMFTRVYIPGHYALGAVEKAGKGALLLGYLIFVKSGQNMMIEWIWVEPTVRYRGVGDALMKAAFRIAGGFGIPAIGAYLPYLYGRSAICPGEASFAGRYFGMGESEIPGQWVISVRNLILAVRRIKRLYESCKEQENHWEIGTLKERGIKGNYFLESLENAPFMEMNYALGGRKEYLEGDISMVCADSSGKARGAVCWQETGDDLYLSALGAEEEGLLYKLFLASVLQIIKLYEPETLIRIELWGFTYGPLLRRILGWNGGAVVMSGDVARVLERGTAPGVTDIGELVNDAVDAVITGYLFRTGKAASDMFSPEAMEALAAGAEAAAHQGTAETETLTRELSLKEVAKLPLLKEDINKKGLLIGSLKMLKLPTLQEWMDTLMLQNMEDAPPWLRIIPLEYYDMETSVFYKDSEEESFGLCLTHYEPETKSLIYVALDGSYGENKETRLRSLLATSLHLALREFEEEITLVIPEKKTHFVLDVF